MRIHVIQVTQEDIANGKQADSKLCPIALAANRVIGRPGHVAIVGTDTIYLTGCDDAYFLSNKAKKFIVNFDAYGPKGVNPTIFEVEGNQAVAARQPESTESI